jgi:hypothetical protein
VSNKPGGKHYRAIAMTYKGKYYETLKSLYDDHDGVTSYSTFILRFDSGWDMDRALTEESRDKRLKIKR